MTHTDIGRRDALGRRRKGDRVRYVTNSFRMAGKYPWAFGSGANRLGELWNADDTGPCFCILEGVQAIHLNTPGGDSGSDPPAPDFDYEEMMRSMGGGMGGGMGGMDNPYMQKLKRENPGA